MGVIQRMGSVMVMGLRLKFCRAVCKKLINKSVLKNQRIFCAGQKRVICLNPVLFDLEHGL